MAAWLKSPILSQYLAVWLAQLDGYQTIVREVEGSSPRRTNIQGLNVKLTEEKMLPLPWHLH